jgi:hypothetical protein
MIVGIHGLAPDASELLSLLGQVTTTATFPKEEVEAQRDDTS